MTADVGDNVVERDDVIVGVRDAGAGVSGEGDLWYAGRRGVLCTEIDKRLTSDESDNFFTVQ